MGDSSSDLHFLNSSVLPLLFLVHYAKGAILSWKVMLNAGKAVFNQACVLPAESFE